MSYLSYFPTLTPSVNGFAELPATLVSEHGYPVGIHFKRVGFESYIYIYIYTCIYILCYILSGGPLHMHKSWLYTYIRVCLVVGWPPPMQNPGYATVVLWCCGAVVQWCCGAVVQCLQSWTLQSNHQVSILYCHVEPLTSLCCSSSISCVNKYLAIDSGGYVYE